MATIGPMVPATAATIGSLFHHGGKICANDYDSAPVNDRCPGCESAMEPLSRILAPQRKFVAGETTEILSMRPRYYPRTRKTVKRARALRRLAAGARHGRAADRRGPKRRPGSLR